MLKGRTALTGMESSLFISCAIVGFALSPLGVVAGFSEEIVKAPLAEKISPAVGATELGGFEGYEEGADVRGVDSVGMVGAQPRTLSGGSSPLQCQLNTSQETLQVDLNRYSLDAKFDCGLSAAENKVAPECTSATSTSCDPASSDCTGTIPISTAVGVTGTTSIDPTTKQITVKLDDSPKNTNGKLYFKCTKAANTCTVTVNMPAPLESSKPSFSHPRELN